MYGFLFTNTKKFIDSDGEKDTPTTSNRYKCLVSRSEKRRLFYGEIPQGAELMVLNKKVYVAGTMIFDRSAELITDTLLLAYAITIDSPHGIDGITQLTKDNRIKSVIFWKI